MRPIRLLHTLIACIVASLWASAQSHPTLQFRIIDDADEPVAYAVVVAVNEQDSITSAPAFSSETGDVSLALDDAAAYTALKVQCMGYVTATIPLPLASSTIVLAKDPNMLGEVVVKAGPALQQKNGKFIFNPSELYTATADAYTLLRFSPLLSVSENSVSILGRSSIIYINGRDPKMSTAAVMAMLQALPPDRIKRIEIEPTAGAEQSASMQGGIVNVVLDNPYEGYLGNASVKASYDNKRLSPRLTSFNAYTVGKFRSSALLSYGYTNSHTSSITRFDYGNINRALSQYADSKSHGNNCSAQLNFAYDFSNTSVLSMAVSVSDRDGRWLTSTESAASIGGVPADNASTEIIQRMPWSRPSYKISAAYTLKLSKTGGVFDVEASFTSNISKYSRDEYTDDNDPIPQSTRWTYGGIHVKPTYKQKFNDVHTLNVGYSLARYTTDKDIRQPVRASHFIYTDMINSVFADWSASWSDAFFTRLGMRMENTEATSHQRVGDQKSSRNYTDFIPSLTVGLNMPWRGDQSLRLSINRYLSRPHFTRLDPFKVWSSPYTYSVGNPDLKPVSSWYFALNYSFLQDFNFSVSSYLSKDNVSGYTYTDKDGNIVSSSRNFGRSNLIDLNLSYYKTIAKIWNLRASASASYNKVEATLQDNNLGYDDWSYNFYLSNNFTLSEKHHCYLELWWSYMSPVKMLTISHPTLNRINFAITKQFNCGLTISGNIGSVLGITDPRIFTSPEFSSYQKVNTNILSFSITARYAFGKQRVKRADSRRYDSPLDSRL